MGGIRDYGLSNYCLLPLAYCLILYTYFELKQYEPARKKHCRLKNVQICINYMESRYPIFGFSALWADDSDSSYSVDGVGDSN